MLAITTQLLPDESVDSWVEKLASLNSCTTRDLVRKSTLSSGGRGATLSISLRPATAQALEDLTGVPLGKILHASLYRYREHGLASIAGHRAGEGTWAKYRGTKFCPSCLTERGLRWKLYWHLAWTNICPIHQCLLIDRCPTCGTPPRDSGYPHPLSPLDIPGNPRTRLCPDGCCTQLLAQSETVWLPSSSTLLPTAAAIQAVLDHGHAQLAYSAGVPVAARHFFADLTILTRHALHATASGEVCLETVDHAGLSHIELHPGGQAPSPPTAKFTAANHPTPAAMELAINLALSVLNDPRTGKASPYPIRDHWLSEERLKVIRNSLRRTQKSTHSRYLERLVGRTYTERTSSPISDTHGHRRQNHSVAGLIKLRAHHIDAMSLPSCLWPEAIRHSPELPPRVARGFPYLAPIALAAIGRQPKLDNLAIHFGLDAETPALRSALNHLISNESGASAIDYLATLHDHLRANPPPIDYRRRRRLFPAPTELGSTRLRRLSRVGGVYKTNAFNWMISRYVWQLLTGYDPFVTYGAKLLHGPAAYQYRTFVRDMHPDLQHAAGEVAERLLLEHRIGEPVAFDLVWDAQAQTWAPTGRGTHFLENIGRSDLRRSSLSIELAASTAGDMEELMHLALSGEHHLALRVYRFVLTHRLPTYLAASAALGLSRYQVQRETKRIEAALGEPLFGGPPRQLTDAGRDLAAFARPYLADLQRIAGPVAIPKDLGLLEPPAVKRR